MVQEPPRWNAKWPHKEKDMTICIGEGTKWNATNKLFATQTKTQRNYMWLPSHLLKACTRIRMNTRHKVEAFEEGFI